MPHEFSAQAAHVSAESITEEKVKSLYKKLDGTLLAKRTLAEKVYGEYGKTAEDIDTREQTSVPFRRNAVYLASLVATACIRGAQLS